MSNVFAQAEALAFGKTEAEVRAEGTPPPLAPHRVMQGIGRRTLLLVEKLTPRTLGMLVALYRSQRLHAGDDLGNRVLRSMGRGAWPGARQSDRPGAGERRRAAADARVDECVDPVAIGASGR